MIMTKQRLIFLIFILTFLRHAASQKDKEQICKSVTVRSVKDLHQLEHCKIVAGHVKVVLTEFSSKELVDMKPLDIEDITEYFLIYRANGLISLEGLFPKLKVIRGAQLLYDQYALVVLENRNLENIGLLSLLRVVRGSVRIESNPTLCFATTIDWVSIMGHANKQFHYILKNNKHSNHCPTCRNITITNETESQHCWNIGKSQKLPLEKYTSNCQSDCASKKCNDKGKCCSGNCLTSCSDENCEYCTNLISEKKCVDNCLPPKLMAFNRQCVLDCHRYGLVRLGTECVEKCPKLYREVTQHGIVTSCSLQCIGNFTIRNSKELKGFWDCTILTGSLTLELTDLNNTKINEVYHELSNLREITGYLKVIKSPQILSLSFLKNLHTIGGTFLVDDIYALYVVDNHHLQEIWNDNQKVTIVKGRIAFHLNPNLCYEKIVKIANQMKETNITIIDVSPNSNGERTVCKSKFPPLNVTVEAVNAHEARILLNYRTSEEIGAVLGYTYYYKEAPERNISEFDRRHACGDDDWFSESAFSRARRHVLRHLKPATQYAYFVKTFVIIDYHYDYDAKSEIQYFWTAEAKPGPVQKIFFKVQSASEIELHWWPPLQPNGKLEKYLIRYESVTANHTMDPHCSGGQCNNRVCMCPKLDPETSGPPPKESDFYSREFMVFEAALINFIYVSNKEKRKATEMSKADQKRAQEAYERILEENANYTRRLQDKNEEDFEIAPVLPVCTVKNPSVVYKKENQCTDLEEFESNYEVAGDKHRFMLKDLEAQVTYRIGIRACVQGLDNGCGPETIIYAQTESKSVENFLEKLIRTPS